MMSFAPLFSQQRSDIVAMAPHGWLSCLTNGVVVKLLNGPHKVNAATKLVLSIKIDA